jgi:hypothetical protein
MRAPLMVRAIRGRLGSRGVTGDPMAVLQHSQEDSVASTFSKQWKKTFSRKCSIVNHLTAAGGGLPMDAPCTLPLSIPEPRTA